jgi:tripartite-type tricarboxylate transporter receptor subunit TctC
MRKRRRLPTWFALAAALASVQTVAGETYPSRPITAVVAFPAGGPADGIGRIMAEGMRAPLGQPVIIENAAGANGSIGVGRVARAAPDGYTLSFGVWNAHVANGAIYALQYDVLTDFEPIALISSYPYLIAAKKGVPANDLEGFIGWLKANPDKASMGTPGVGSPGHVGGLLFQDLTGTRFQFVPYRGQAPAMQALVAGQIDMMLGDPATSLPQLRAGTIKAYAVTTKSPLPVASDIPTVDTAGLPGFYVSNWQAIWAPKGTPKNVIAKLNAAVVDALGAPAVRSRLADLGQEIFPREQQTPEALRAYHKAEIEKWWPIIKAANIKAE